MSSPFCQVLWREGRVWYKMINKVLDSAELIALFGIWGLPCLRLGMRQRHGVIVVEECGIGVRQGVRWDMFPGNSLRLLVPSTMAVTRHPNVGEGRIRRVR
jgi:hypothetical protein